MIGRQLQYLNALSTRTRWTGVEAPKLEAPRRILSLLGNPQDRVPAVHITGTNGKGTVGALLAAMFRADGKHVGQLVSPHLQSVNERLLLDGVPVKSELLDDALCRIGEAESKEQIKLTYFEAAVIASFLICAELQLDWMVVEVGIGGRLDATNLMKAPRATVIASIGLDHTNILGNSDREIALDKAGIFRKAVPAIVCKVSESAMGAIRSYAAELPCPVLAYDEAFKLEGESVCDSAGWQFQLPVKERKLVAEYQLLNYALAAYVGHTLGLSDAVLAEGMKRMRWPGRLEELTLSGPQKKLPLLIDGAHNADGVRGLIDFLSHSEAKEFHILISIFAAKDYFSMAELFREWKDHSNKSVSFYFCPMEKSEFIPPGELAGAFGSGTVCGSRKDAFSLIAERASENSLVVLAGSLYFIGEARGDFVQEPFRSIVD